MNVAVPWLRWSSNWRSSGRSSTARSVSDAGWLASLLRVTDVDPQRTQTFGGEQAVTGKAGEVQAVDLVAAGGCHGRLPCPLA